VSKGGRLVATLLNLAKRSALRQLSHERGAHCVFPMLRIAECRLSSQEGCCGSNQPTGITEGVGVGLGVEEIGALVQSTRLRY